MMTMDTTMRRMTERDTRDMMPKSRMKMKMTRTDTKRKEGMHVVMTKRVAKIHASTTTNVVMTMHDATMTRAVMTMRASGEVASEGCR